MTRKPRPARTGRGDPMGSTSQYGAGCGMVALLVAASALAVPIVTVAAFLR